MSARDILILIAGNVAGIIICQPFIWSLLSERSRLLKLQASRRILCDLLIDRALKSAFVNTSAEPVIEKEWESL